MKTLYLIRHAKSSWKDNSLSDFERPLNKRGKRDAPFMAKLLAKQKIYPDLVIASPAVRALTTAKIFSEEMNYPLKDIIHNENLYGASVNDIIHAVEAIDDKYSNVFLFGHNPGLTDFSNRVSDAELLNIPTCGVVKLKLESDSWKRLLKRSCKLDMFEYPKKYFD